METKKTPSHPGGSSCRLFGEPGDPLTCLGQVEGFFIVFHHGRVSVLIDIIYIYIDVFPFVEVV